MSAPKHRLRGEGPVDPVASVCAWLRQAKRAIFNVEGEPVGDSRQFKEIKSVRFADVHGKPARRADGGHALHAVVLIEFVDGTLVRAEITAST